MPIRRIWIINIVLLLSGCGFKMRQPLTINAALNPFSIESENTLNQQFKHQLSEQLSKHGAHLVQKGKTRLQINYSNTTDAATHNNSSTQGTVYTLGVHAEIILKDSKGNLLDQSRQFTTRQNLTIGPNDSIETNRQAIDIRQHLQAHLINQIVHYLTQR